MPRAVSQSATGAASTEWQITRIKAAALSSKLTIDSTVVNKIAYFVRMQELV
jgi:hypothetical protein